MTDDNFPLHLEDLAEDFFSDCANRAQEVEVATRNDLEDFVLTTSRTLGALLSLHESRGGHRFDPDDGKISGQMYLSAQFLSGAAFSIKAILSGNYPIAANILKQQLETLAALEEVNRGTRKEGRTPNVGNALPGLKSAYDRLNDVAHPSNSDAIRSLSHYVDSEKQGPTHVSIYRREVARILLGYQILIMFEIALRYEEVAQIVYNMRYDENELSAIKSARDFLISERFIVMKPKPLRGESKNNRSS